MKPTAPPWLTRAFVTAALVTMASILVWNAVHALFSLIMVVVTAVFVALAMEPPVDWLVKKGWRRGLATGLVMLVVFAAIGAGTAAFGNMLVGQITDLVEQIPRVYEQVAEWLADRFGAKIPTQNEALQQVVQSWGAKLAQNALVVGGQVFSGLISALGGLLLVFYISAQGPKLRATICSPLPPDHQRLVLRVWATAQEKTAGYISSRVILALINSSLTFIFLSILGVRYALPLSLFSGIVSQFVPTVGTYLGGAAPVLFALVADPLKGLAVLIFIVAYQQVENFLIAPKLTSKTMEINPAVAFVSVIALGAILGPIGAFLSLPLVATCQAVISTYIHRYELVDDDLLRQDATPTKVGATPDQAAGGSDARADAGAGPPGAAAVS
ncbi:MAG: AI-2E family transporter [Bifidobacteriaceae bacterium]|jgi:predicted PurR-regulated permease PerM|nr:AI-2E family transporter [Bifidobacteriaceae bacterium]